jgi:hypothetical protein
VVCLLCAYGVPVVCLWCACGLPVVCLLCVCGVPVVCLWCGCGVPVVNGRWTIDEIVNKSFIVTKLQRIPHSITFLDNCYYYIVINIPLISTGEGILLST